MVREPSYGRLAQHPRFRQYFQVFYADWLAAFVSESTIEDQIDHSFEAVPGQRSPMRRDGDVVHR